MVDAFAITSPPYNWYLQVDNDKTVSIKKTINFLKKNPTSLCLSKLHSVTGSDNFSQFFGI